MAKNILADFDFAGYEDLLDWAKEEDVHIVHTHFDHTGGYTFAWKRASEFVKGRMVEVAVSFCSPRDTFCRKIGANNALTNFENGNTILLPVGDSDSAVIVEKLRKVFYYASSPALY